MLQLSTINLADNCAAIFGMTSQFFSWVPFQPYHVPSVKPEESTSEHAQFETIDSACIVRLRLPRCSSRQTISRINIIATCDAEANARR